MPSHLKEKDGPLPDDVSAFDIEANDVADHYAGQAASRFQIPDEAAANFVYYAKLVKKIQKRLSYILMNLPSRKIDKANRQQADKKPRVTLDHLLHDTHHIVKVEKGRVLRTVCLNNFSKRDPALKEWLKAPCIRQQLSPVAPLVAPAALSPDSVIHFGNKTIHFSHKIAKYRGLLYCTKCGSLGTNQARYLAKPCEPPKLVGTRNIRYISAGKRPAGMDKWPDEQ
jgi:hypothetical protein